MQQSTTEWKFPMASDFPEQKDEVTELFELELSAAKQLLTELTMIKRSVYANGALTPMLLIKTKQMIRGLISKYHNAGLLLDEDVTLTITDYSSHPNIIFKYTPGLSLLMESVVLQTQLNKE
jgi:hypothetical protein